MFSYLARSSLAVTSRGYHIARTMTVARNVKPPQMSKYVLFRQVKPVTTSCFRLASDPSASSGKKILHFVVFLFIPLYHVRVFVILLDLFELNFSAE